MSDSLAVWSMCVSVTMALIYLQRRMAQSMALLRHAGGTVPRGSPTAGGERGMIRVWNEGHWTLSDNVEQGNGDG